MSTPSKLYQYHSIELKSRIFYLLFTFFCTFCILFFNMEFLFYQILPKHFAFPLAADQSIDLIFTEIFEAFFSYLWLSGYLSFCIWIPFLYYHLYSFLRPGLSFKENQLLKLFLWTSLCFFLFAHLLTYFVILPSATAFFLTFQSSSLADSAAFFIPNISFLGRIYPWITFLVQIFSLVSFLFQLPLVFFFLFLIFLKNFWQEEDSIKLMTIPGMPSFLSFQNTLFFRKILFFFLLILTAVFSPPDLSSQIFLFIPLILIIELFLFAILFYLEYLKKIKSVKKTKP